MSLRRRLTLAAAAAVAVTPMLVAGAAYFVVHQELINQVDEQLTDTLGRRLPPGCPNQQFGFLPVRRGGPTPYVQLVGPDGDVICLFGTEQVALPVSAQARRVAIDGDR